MAGDTVPGSPLGSGMVFAKGIILMEDFEGTWQWLESGTGGDDVHTNGQAGSYHGTKGMTLRTRAASAAEDDIVTITNNIVYPRGDFVLVRMKLGLPNLSTVKRVVVGLLWENGAQGYKSGIYWEPNVPAGGYHNSAGAYVAEAGFGHGCEDGQWTLLEFGVDLSLAQYIRANLGGVEFDMAGIDVENTAAETTRRLQVQVSVVAAGAAQASLWGDDLYIGEDPEL